MGGGRIKSCGERSYGEGEAESSKSKVQSVRKQRRENNPTPREARGKRRRPDLVEVDAVQRGNAETAIGESSGESDARLSKIIIACITVLVNNY